MARPQSKAVVLYRRAGTWWVRFTVPPHVARNFKPPPGIPLRLDTHNRARLSLETDRKSKAEEIARTIQSQLDLAWKQALNFKAFAILTGDQGKTARSIAELFDELQSREAQRVAVWRTCTNPIEARNRHALHPRTAKRYALIRSYLTEYLAAKFPNETILVSHFGLDSDSRPHLLAFREWLIGERGIQRMTYKQLRAYFSEAWQSIALPRHYADTNPWRDPALRPVRSGETPRTTLSIEQRQTILALPSTWHHNALKLLLLTGHRVAELCWLTRTDVDTAARTVRWLNSKTGRYETLPATDAELAVLADQLALTTGLYLIARKDGSQCEAHFLETKLGRALKRALTNCALPKVSPQSLRRTWQTVAARLAKTDPHAIKDLMMHKTLDQQLTYIQVDVEALRSSAEHVQKKLSGG